MEAPGASAPRGEDRDFLTMDVFTSERREKPIEGQIDGWDQSESGVADIVEYLSEPGDLVVDPAMGGGTTAVACHQLGRRFIGCDIDPDAVRATAEGWPADTKGCDRSGSSPFRNRTRPTIPGHRVGRR